MIAMAVMSALLAWCAAGDKAIERDMRARMERSKLASEPVKFTVEDGVVTWEGTVSSPQRKGAATRMAHSAGAQKVNNRLRVTSKAGPPRVARIVH